MKCPHCKKEYMAPMGLLRHTEIYEGGRYHVRCARCNETVLVRAEKIVKVKITVVGEGDPEEQEMW